MLCSRCNRREVPVTLQGAAMCQVCNVEVAIMKKGKHLTEEEIMEYHVTRVLVDGCKECGDKEFGYEAGVVEENGLKWFVIRVQCGACDNKYEEILEVKIDESFEGNEEE
tara:strand:- start:337 stop:666 length:330 start_codon:yes stop_codon:yes gene_type:complete